MCFAKGVSSLWKQDDHMNLAIVATIMSKASLSACITATYMPDIYAYIDTLLIVHNKAKLLHFNERL